MSKTTDDRKVPFMDPKDVHMGNLHRVLERAVNKAGDDDLAQHLKKVFGFLVLNYPGQALEKFEEVSQLMKEGKDISKYLKVDDARDYSAVAKDQASYIVEMQKRLNKAAPEGEEGEEAAEEVGPVGFVQDMRADSRQWQWAGIGFGEQETYRLQMHLKKLSKDSNATMCRFFGKILGTERDYYIAETQVEAAEEGEDVEHDADFEPNGSGVNVYTYWVTHSTMGEWKRLPDVSPSDIRAARQIRILFSGNLERDIYTNPFFYGKEKIYLRAQIARITHSATLIPQGLMKISEENAREVEDNAPEEGEIQLPSTHSMCKPEMWVHKNLNILKNCRTAHAEPEEPAEPSEDYDVEVEKKKIEQADPFEDRLKSISKDSSIALTKQVNQSPWVVRLYGDASTYADEKKPGAVTCNGTVVVRSLQWPGSYTFYQSEAWHQIYVGHGHKYEQAVCYFPVEPPMVIDDPEEFRVEPEPTPLEEPVVEAVADPEAEEAQKDPEDSN